jgi:hypothetical protein
MPLDIEAMQEIAQRLWAEGVERRYGEPGMYALRRLMSSIRKVFHHVEPDGLAGTLIVFVRLGEGDASDLGTAPRHYHTIEALAEGFDSAQRATLSVIEARSDGSWSLWTGLDQIPHSLEPNALIYVYQSRVDSILLGGNLEAIPNPSPSHSSVFSVPTYRSLEVALEKYDVQMVRSASCLILRGIWFDKNRLFLRAGPESTMRDSLLQFLRSTLGAEVRPEQYVDASHPCDIKVTFMLTNRIALLEIKWLGKSKNEEGSITANYAESRAIDGARQLVNYLDMNLSHSPSNETVGYLIVIDGRRKGLNPATTSISEHHGTWYRHKDISYNPSYHEQRADFKPPLRMFCEPICSGSQ